MATDEGFWLNCCLSDGGTDDFVRAVGAESCLLRLSKAFRVKPWKKRNLDSGAMRMKDVYRWYWMTVSFNFRHSDVAASRVTRHALYSHPKVISKSANCRGFAKYILPKARRAIVPEIKSVHSRQLVDMRSGLGYNPRNEPSAPKLREIFTKSISLFQPPPPPSKLYYLASACLPLPQGSPSEPYSAKVSALSLPTSSFLLTLPTPLTSLSLPVCSTHPSCSSV